MIKRMMMVMIGLASPFWSLAEKNAAPAIGGIAVGTPREAAFKIAKSSELFKGCDIILDSNVLLIGAKEKGVIPLDSGLGFSSLKVMFNKKKSAQGLSAVFQTQTNDGVESAYRYAERLLGAPEEKSEGPIGFKFEAEWELGKYGASFFASDQAFEAYLLIAFAAFVKEEEDRGNRHPK
jgi:hypothetical protein